jgi:PhzF family phenazine biosynthesis protein
MNISETAFVANAWTKGTPVEPNRYTLRWFTPTNEVELCGHATLASARAVFDRELKNSTNNTIKFETKYKGLLEAVVNSSLNIITLNFPVNDCQPLDTGSNPWVSDVIKHTLGPNLSPDLIVGVEYSSGTKKVVLRMKDTPESDGVIYQVVPNIDELLKIDSNGLCRGVCVTQKAESVHFLSRYFSPWNGIVEDPVTGALHTALAPYWKREYSKIGVQLKQLIGKQCSSRGGVIICEIIGDRVQLSGSTTPVVSGVLTL